MLIIEIDLGDFVSILELERRHECIISEEVLGGRVLLQQQLVVVLH